MKILAALVALLLMCADSRAEFADAPKRTMPHQKECGVPLPTDFWKDSAAKPFQRSEEWAWNDRICLGRWADMRDAPDGGGEREECNPTAIETTEEGIPASRKLRPEFLELILSHDQWVSSLRHPEVGIKCALVPGDIYLNNHEIAPAFSFHQGKIDGEVSLLGTKFKRTLSLNDSTVTGRINAEHMEIGGVLQLRNAKVKDVNLNTTRIDREVVFNGSTVSGSLDAGGMEVGDALFLENGNFQKINLLTARITGDVSFEGSTVSGRVSAGRMQIGGGLYLRNGGTFADISLIDTKVDRSMQIFGSTFGGKFNLTGATIDGELHLSSKLHQSRPKWKSDASLVLRNAKAEVLQAGKDGWIVSGGDEFVKTDLTGFTYNRLGGLDSPDGAGMGDESADWLIKWIQAQRDHGKFYDPQPYSQLVNVLKAAGASRKAKEIRYAKFKSKSNLDTPMNVNEHVVDTIARFSIGYGVYPFWILYWFFGLVALGGWLAQYSKDSSIRRAMGLWYSLENALPLVETNDRFKNVKHCRPILVHFFHFQKAVGFVIATVLVGALTLLGG